MSATPTAEARARRALPWAAAAVLCLLALAVAGVVTLLLPAGVALDVRLADATYAYAPAALAGRADAVARLVDPALYAMWTVLLCAVAVLRGRVRVAVAVLVVAVGTGLTTQLLKALVAHPRAADGAAAFSVDPASWPSGHTTAAATLALCAVLVAPRLLQPLVAAGAVLATGAVGAATVVAGWHLPSDVLAGGLVAAAWSAAAVAALRAVAPVRLGRAVPEGGAPRLRPTAG